jgi:hypothetical protein
MTRIAAGGADETAWPRSRPVAWISDEHGDGIRALMAVDGGESHLTEHDRSAYRPADIPETLRFRANSKSMENGETVVDRLEIQDCRMGKVDIFRECRHV